MLAARLDQQQPSAPHQGSDVGRLSPGLQQRQYQPLGDHIGERRCGRAELAPHAGGQLEHGRERNTFARPVADQGEQRRAANDVAVGLGLDQAGRADLVDPLIGQRRETGRLARPRSAIAGSRSSRPGSASTRARRSARCRRPTPAADREFPPGSTRGAAAGRSGCSRWTCPGP